MKIKKDEIILVKNLMRYIDVAIVLNVYKSKIDNEIIVYVSSLIGKEKSYINVKDILGKVDLVEGVEDIEELRKMVQSK